MKPSPFLLYIYIYASGLISGPDFRVSWVNKRTGSSETACFIVRNGVTVFRGIVATTGKSRNSRFGKMALFEAFCALFWPPFPETLFLTSCSCGLSQICRRGGRTRNATKQGVSDRFGVFLARRLLLCLPKLRFCGPNLTNFFSASYYFLFSEVRFFGEIGFWGSKTRWGCRTEVIFKRVFLALCRARAQIWRAASARARYFFLGFRVGPTNGLAAAVRRVFASFSVFVADPFSQTSSGPFHTPLFLFRCFSLLFDFFLGLGATPLCTCVFGQLAFNLPFFFRVFLQKHCFPLKKGLFLFISRCLPFVLLGFFHYLCHSLSLYISLSLSFFFFLFFPLLSCLSFYLPWFLAVFCCLVSSFVWFTNKNKYIIWKVYFHQIFLLFWHCFSNPSSYFCLFCFFSWVFGST